MKSFDLSPLFRSSMGFDDTGSMLDHSFQLDKDSGDYPAYDIEAFADGKYWIRLAVPGFEPKDLNVDVQQDMLVIKGDHIDEEHGGHMVFQSVTRRSFERRFQLTDHIDVLGAKLSHGLLTIELQKNRPDVTKAHKVDIQVEH